MEAAEPKQPRTVPRTTVGAATSARTHCNSAAFGAVPYLDELWFLIGCRGSGHGIVILISAFFG
jgi:hypothetical protein